MSEFIIVYIHPQYGLEVVEIKEEEITEKLVEYKKRFQAAEVYEKLLDD